MFHLRGVIPASLEEAHQTTEKGSMLTVTYMQLTTMNAWKLATDVHHLDMRNKAPFTFDFAECHLVVQAPGSDGFLRNLSLLQKVGSFTSYSEDIQPWVQSRAHCILPNWSQIQQSGTAGHFTNKLPYILKCKKQENFKWEETAQSLLTEQGSSTNSSQPPTLGKPKNKTLTNLYIPTDCQVVHFTKHTTSDETRQTVLPVLVF
jgi:hypothetical protein